MNNSIEWSLDAIADLQEIYDYVAEDRISAADKLIEKLLYRLWRSSSGRRLRVNIPHA